MANKKVTDVFNRMLGPYTMQFTNITETSTNNITVAARAHGGDSRRHSTALVLQLLGTPTTHYYLNPEIPETYQILNTYKENPDTEPVIDIQRQWHQDRELEKPETEYDYVICSKLTQNTIRMRYTLSNVTTKTTIGDSSQSPKVGTASVSDNTKYAFIVENPNGSNVLHQDLEQIHEDDLEAMDLKWQLSLLSVRAKKYYQRTGCTAPKGKEGSIRSDMANNKFNKQGLKVIVIPQSPRQVDKSKIIDKIKNGMGYHDVTPPLPLIFNAPPKHEYVQRCQEEFQHPAIEGYRPKILKECK
ncbi:hypothetical protein Tco_0812372 [Tanacetum coccineum]